MRSESMVIEMKSPAETGLVLTYAEIDSDIPRSMIKPIISEFPVKLQQLSPSNNLYYGVNCV
jgi:hypothetical protein